MKILSIETSCDETSAAIVENGTRVLSNIISSSSNLFYETGGVVPEIAARKQLEYIIPVIDKALGNDSIAHIDALACTVGPGLIGSLLVGVNSTKALSLIYNKPIIPVNHLLGHLYSTFVTSYLGEKIGSDVPQYPLIALIISGGHTDLIYMPTENINSLEYIGSTKDDAVGEAFDKTARLLGLSKYLGGIKISKHALSAKHTNHLSFPRPLINSNDFMFSFSGLKTAVIRLLEQYENSEQLMNNQDLVADICYEFENAVVDVLMSKVKKAVSVYNPKSIVVAGGVSANTSIRSAFANIFDMPLYFPHLSLTGDNAAMIGSAAFFLRSLATYDLATIVADPSLSFDKIY